MQLKMMLLKNVHDKLIAKVNNIDTSEFVLKIQNNTNKLDSEKKIPDTNGIVKKQIIMLRLLNWKIKYQVLVAQLQMY